MVRVWVRNSSQVAGVMGRHLEGYREGLSHPRKETVVNVVKLRNVSFEKNFFMRNIFLFYPTFSEAVGIEIYNALFIFNFLLVYS